MTYQEIIDQVVKLPTTERLTILEVVSHSLREELTRQSEPTTEYMTSVEKTRAEILRDILRESALWRLLGIAATDGPAPTNEELKEDYIDYLEKKYS